MSRVYKAVLYSAFAALVASGIAAELAPAWRAALMQVHGAAAMAALVLLGGLLVRHVGAGWYERKNRCSGALLLATSLWLTLTGWVLYYSGGDALRHFAGQSHLWVGIALAAALALHIRRAALT
jgi:hypothetical protein